MNNEQYTSRQPDTEQEKEVIEEITEERKNDSEGESDSDEDENDNLVIEIDETMNEVFGTLF